MAATRMTIHRATTSTAPPAKAVTALIRAAAALVTATAIFRDSSAAALAVCLACWISLRWPWRSISCRALLAALRAVVRALPGAAVLMGFGGAFTAVRSTA